MKGYVVTAPEVMEMREMSVPKLKGKDALIKIAYMGICGSDVHVYKGETPIAKENVVIGHEYSGIIEEVFEEDNVKGLKPGDKVTGWILETCGECDACIAGHRNCCRNIKCYGTHIDGTLREYISAPISMLYKLPDDADLRLYALVEPMTVATYAINEAPVLLGDTVLVIGGGAIGLCTAIAARMAGATKIAVSEIALDKISLIEELGFNVINPQKGDAVEQAKELTGGIGFDCIFEASGSAKGYELFTKAGTFRVKGVNIGMNFNPSPLVTRDIMVSEMKIQAIRNHPQSVFERVVNIFNNLKENDRRDLYKLITNEYDFSESCDALDFCVKERKYCKVMIKVDETLK